MPQDKIVNMIRMAFSQRNNFKNIYHVLILLISAGSHAHAQQILVPPYLQPGNVSTLSKEEKVIIWQTDSLPGNFSIEYGVASEFQTADKRSTVKISSLELRLKNKTTILYRATLPRLKFDARYTFRVFSQGDSVGGGTFKTRTKNSQTRFAVFGDCGARSAGQRKIAYAVYQQEPDFVVVTGDNVYSSGLESEYRSNFFPAYLAPQADTLHGAPLMNTVPFYMIVGNHDVRGRDLDKYPDGLAYFYYGDLPDNGPVTENPLTVAGDPETIKTFRRNTKGRFPNMANFSFDHGNVHITCIDSNPYVNPLEPAFVSWLTNDLKQSKADWKFVAFHHPGFNASNAHYNYQLMRLLSPVLEKLDVDIVLAGHVHNYQRTLPLRFAPRDSANHYVVTPEGRVDGVFTMDEKFDGTSNTDPEGIIYIVTGAGGAGLYDQEISGRPELWRHTPPENWMPFTEKLISDVHSFTLIETVEKKLVLKQINSKGAVIDEVVVTK